MPGDRRPPFEPGNLRGLRHGAWSARFVDPISAELIAGALADQPQLERYPTALVAWARAEARCLLLHDWLTRAIEDGALDDDQDRPSMKWVAYWEAAASRARERLGLDPLSEADLAEIRARATSAGYALSIQARESRQQELLADARERLALLREQPPAIPPSPAAPRHEVATEGELAEVELEQPADHADPPEIAAGSPSEPPAATPPPRRKRRSGPRPGSEEWRRARLERWQPDDPNR